MCIIVSKISQLFSRLLEVAFYDHCIIKIVLAVDRVKVMLNHSQLATRESCEISVSLAYYSFVIGLKSTAPTIQFNLPWCLGNQAYTALLTSESYIDPVKCAWNFNFIVLVLFMVIHGSSFSIYF